MTYNTLDLDDLDYSNTSSDDYRTHFIDNLRTTLTILLIVQHSIIETASASYPYFNSLPLTLFVVMSKTIVVGLFFFLSGYASSISRTSPTYYSGGRSDAEFVWQKIVRLLFPGVLYGALGHLLLWMVLTKSWPALFGSVGAATVGGNGQISTIAWGFARLEGPVVHILFLYGMDMVYVGLFPTKKGATAIAGPGPVASPKAEPDALRTVKRKLKIRIKSKRNWYTLVACALVLLSFWTFAVAATGRGEKPLMRFRFNLASYDAIPPMAPLQYILAYLAGIQLYRWQNYMLVPTPYTFPAFLLSITISLFSLMSAMDYSPTLLEFANLNTPWPVHPSFVGGGFNFHTLFYAVWSSLTFFAVAATLVSLYAQWEWTRRDWGSVAKHTYVPVWVHMIPVVVFVRLLAADGGWSPGRAARGAAAPALAEESVGWRCFLVATGSVICSWFVALTFAGIGWVMGC